MISFAPGSWQYERGGARAGRNEGGFGKGDKGEWRMQVLIPRYDKKKRIKKADEGTRSQMDLEDTRFYPTFCADGQFSTSGCRENSAESPQIGIIRREKKSEILPILGDITENY